MGGFPRGDRELKPVNGVHKLTPSSMHLHKGMFFRAAIIVLSCSVAGLVRADRLLTGDLVGIFRPDAGAHVDITNFANGDASFRTGIATANSFQSGVTFTSQSFSGIDEGETVSLGLLSYYNGVTQAGTSSHSAALDLYLRSSDPAQSWLHLSTLNFTIDATLNTKTSAIPDNFLASYATPEKVFIGGEWGEFAINGLPGMTAVAENSKVDIGNLTLTFAPTVPVPEPASSLLLVTLGLAFIFGYRSDIWRHSFAAKMS